MIKLIIIISTLLLINNVGHAEIVCDIEACYEVPRPECNDPAHCCICDVEIADCAGFCRPMLEASQETIHQQRKKILKLRKKIALLKRAITSFFPNGLR